MTGILDGVRILEVAEHTFVPAASALLADWGAEVIKIEHVERGDAMRGLFAASAQFMPSDVHPLLEHANRGKRSLALDLGQPDGLEILYSLAANSDVFLTNKLQGVRERLQIDVEEIRARNPQIIYVRGTGQGELGPDADKGAYDSLAFWARSGAAMVCMRPEFGEIVPGPPGSGFGDSIGAMTIAGGIMGALYHRERTGEAKTVDVSLFGAGLWAMGQSIAMSVLLDVPLVVPEGAPRRLGNPMVASYRTSDGRFVALTCLQAAKYWPSLCRLLGREDLAVDPRFGDDAQLWANGIEGGDEIAAMFAQRPLAEWRTILEHFDGQWAVVQHTLEAANDPQTVANGYLQDCESASGVPFKLVAAPVQFDEAPAVPSRSPEFNEHGDDILQELGLDWDAIIDLKLRGVVA